MSCYYSLRTVPERAGGLQSSHSSSGLSSPRGRPLQAGFLCGRGTRRLAQHLPIQRTCGTGTSQCTSGFLSVGRMDLRACGQRPGSGHAEHDGAEGRGHLSVFSSSISYNACAIFLAADSFPCRRVAAHAAPGRAPTRHGAPTARHSPQGHLGTTTARLALTPPGCPCLAPEAWDCVWGVGGNPSDP